MTRRSRWFSVDTVGRLLSAVAAGALMAATLSAGAALPERAASATISGTVVAPSDVPGLHRFLVTAWLPPARSNGYDVLVTTTEVTVGSGEAGAFTLSGGSSAQALEAGGTYRVRVVEAPAGDRVPTVGDRFWRDADTFRLARDVTIPIDSSVSGIRLAPSAFSFSDSRIAGVDRYGTSAATTRSFAAGVPVLYIASGEKWADSLSAAPAAARYGGALLLTDPSSLPSSVAAEISRLDPVRTIVVGSEATIPASVYRQVDALVGDVSRIGGTDRYETSRQIIEDAYLINPFSSYNITLVTGNDFPDALSVAPVADEAGGPVLLVDGAKGELDGATRAIIARYKPEQAFVIGRTPSISEGIERELVSARLAESTLRIGGADRYETNRLLNEQWPSPPLHDATYVASGEGFADALSGATLAAAERAGITLSRPTCIPSDTIASLKRAQIDTVHLLGSQRTLSEAVASVTPC